ncbi:MAG TPA: PKD domain-containing protein [Candidatus Peribacteraceae bacterium]|nr:PKD domain-containing protein [Candidatus Peribacteraceae bacterium]
MAAAQSLQQGQVTSAITASTTETVNLMVGDIFEVLPTSDIQNPTYSWILTQDRTFIQAGRAPTFRVRLVQPGTYTLIAEIDAQDLSQRITRTFTINAQPRPLGKIGADQQGGTGATIMPAGSGTELVATDPQMTPRGNVILGSNQQLVKLVPINPDLKPLSLDVNTAVDSNGDGNPSNDVDNQDTFFQSYASPLYVWFASPLTTRTMAVTTIENGNAVTQNIEVDNLDYAQQNGLITSPVSIVTTKTNDNTFNFTPQFTASQMPQTTLLYHWSFGDGQESLLMNPSHTYGSNGAYDVHLLVSDLVNGSQVAVADTQVVVQLSQTGTGGVAQTSSAASSAPAQTTGGGGLFGSLGSLLWLVFIFVIFVVLGLIVTFIVSKLRRGRPLDETFAELEKNIVGKESDEKKTPEPLTITPAPSKPIPTQADVVKREEERTPPNPAAQTPRVDEAAAPSWLRKGLGEKTSIETKEPTPATAAQPAQLQTAPKRSTPPMPVTPKQEPPAPQPPAQSKPAPQLTPKPTPAVQPQQAPTPRPAQANTPQPSVAQQAPLPSWLQPQNAPAAQPASPAKPQTPPAPSQPAPTPKPVTPAPKPAPTPSPAPQPPVQPPAPTPQPQTAKSSAPPMPVMTKAQETPPPQPKPSPAPQTTPASQPQSPAPTVTQPTSPEKPATPASKPVTPPQPVVTTKQEPAASEQKVPTSVPPVAKSDTPARQPDTKQTEPTPIETPASPTPAAQSTPVPTPSPTPVAPAALSLSKAENPQAKTESAPASKQENVAPQQVIPPPPQPVKPAEHVQTDNPIAIIRADSIEEQKKEDDRKEEPPQTTA